MLARIPVAFAAGFLSVITPCVLPLVPGYLSAVSNVEPADLRERRVVRRVVVGSLPFFLGFTVVFVALGVGASALGAVVDKRTQEAAAGFLLVVLGLAFANLLPWPERLVAPGLLQGARRRGSNALLGAAFAVCAAPCIGLVLASILVLASDSSTVLVGASLLAVYAAGLAFAFLLAGIGFTQALDAFRWLRDHYGAIKVGSGLLLTALGLLLFFGRAWWLRSIADRALGHLGLGTD